MATETNETSSSDGQDEKDGKGQSETKDQSKTKGQSKTKDQSETKDQGDDASKGDDGSKGDDSPDDDSGGEKSQAEMAEEAAEAQRQQERESKKKAGSVILVASVILGAIGLLVLLASTAVKQGNPPVEHPLVEQMLAVLGIINLGLAGAVFIRKNWPRALILAMMPLTIVLLLLNLSLVGPVQYLIYLLCVVEIYVMFRQPILDEFDAPKE
jgi:cation transport ATPase